MKVKTLLTVVFVAGLCQVLPMFGATVIITHTGTSDPTTEDANPLQSGTQSWTASPVAGGTDTAIGSAMNGGWDIYSPAGSSLRYLNFLNTSNGYNQLVASPGWEFKVAFSILPETSNSTYGETYALFAYDADPTVSTAWRSFQINFARGTSNEVRIGATGLASIYDFSSSIGSVFTCEIRFDGTDYGFYINNAFYANLTPGTSTLGSLGGVSWGDQSNNAHITSTVFSEVSLSAVPEPSVFAYMTLGTLACFGVICLRRKRNQAGP